MKTHRIFGYGPAILVLAAIFVLSGFALAQGKGKGNGGGNGRGGGQQQVGNGNQGRGGGKHAERAFPQARPQPDFRGRGSGSGNGRQAARPERWGGGQIVVSQQPQQRSRVEYIGPPVADQRRGRGDDKRGRGNEKRERREFERQVRVAQPTWNYERNGRADKRDDRDRDRRYRDDDRSRVFQQHGVPRAWPNNYGAYRSAQVHERNGWRKAEKESRKDWRRYNDRSTGYYNRDQYVTGPTYYSYDPYNVDRDYYGYQDDWRDNLLRSVIGNIFNSGGDPYYNNYQSYVPRTIYRQVDEPAYYSPYVNDPYGYSTGNMDEPYYSDDLVSSLGFGDSGFGGIVSRIFGELLAVGYDDGYQAGQYARSRGYRDNSVYYDPYDPYVYEDVAFENLDYNPYSCLAENRRYLSEGYELGYQDGLRDAGSRGGFDEYGNGSLDLVSVLLGNIL
jgi:hypothetical protein